MLARFLFVVLALACTATAAFGAAKEPGRPWRVGYLSTGGEEAGRSWLAAFEDGMRDLGYVEGRNVVYVRRYAVSAAQQAKAADELRRLQVDVVVAFGGIQALRAANPTLPIVMTVHADPLSTGAVASLAHPGGQVTGLSDLHGELVAKRLEILKLTIPALSRLGVLTNPKAEIPGDQLRHLLEGARSAGVAVSVYEVTRVEDLEAAVAKAARERMDGLVVIAEPTVMGGRNRRRIAELAIAARLPTIGTGPQWAEDGFLISYGAEFHDLWRRAATYVDRILNGASPGDLPIEQASRFELVVNATTAKAIGLPLPAALLDRGARVVR